MNTNISSMIPHNTGDPGVYWFFRIMLVTVLLFCGYLISYGKQKDFKVYAFIAAIIYSLIQGLRWNRGRDYMHYYYDLTGDWYTPEPEFLYKAIVNTFTFIDLPYWVGFITYSLLLISAVLLVFKKYPKAAVWGLPLFFIVTQSMSENLIRQYLAIAFVLFAYYAYLSNKKTYMFFLLCCVPLIHISGIIVVAAFVILYFFKIPIKKPWILLIIYLIIYTLWDISFFSAIVDKVSSIVLGNKFQAYLDNAERWFTSEGSLSNAQSGNAFVDSRSLPNMVAEFLSLVIVIYYGFKVQVTDRKLQIAYYFAYFAIIFKTIGSDIEIYIRFRCWFDYLLPFILGVILYKAPMKSYEKYLVWAILFINYGFYGFIRQIGDIPNSGVAFIWDK